MAEDVTTNELARSLREYRESMGKAMHDLRNDMTIQTGKLELHMNDLANQMAKGYVSNQLWEEVRRNQGERIGSLEGRLTKLEEQTHARFDAAIAKVDALAKSVAEDFEEKDRERKADKNLIFTALGAPMILLLLGIVITILTGG